MGIYVELGTKNFWRLGLEHGILEHSKAETIKNIVEEIKN